MKDIPEANELSESARVFFDIEGRGLKKAGGAGRFSSSTFSNLFSPTRVAVIGASSNPEKVGYAILKNLLDGQFIGEVLPINPTTKELLGQHSYESIELVEGVVDLAIIVLKAVKVPEVLMACGKKGIRAVIVISAGFREVETDQGRQLESELKSIAQQYKMLLIGPNCLGVFNSRSRLNATFGRRYPSTGNIAFVSQSGAIGIQALEFAHQHDIGFSKFITIGNKAVCDENDLILHLADDPDTKVIMMYLESFADGERFKEVARTCVLEKDTPILLLKAGRSVIGKKAALTHTGALASSDEMISYFLRDCGVQRVDTMEELFNTAMVISMQPSVGGKHVAVISNAGGVAIMAVDAAEDFGLSLVDLDEDISHDLEQYLPEAASVHNPVDILGDADEMRYQDTLACLIRSEGLDAIVIICTPQFMTDRKAVILGMNKSIQEARKLGIVLMTVFPSVIEEGLQEVLDQADLPNYEFPEVAMRSLSYAVRCKENAQSIRAAKDRIRNSARAQKADQLIEAHLSHGGVYMNEYESYGLLELYELPIAAYGFAHDEGEAMGRAMSIGFPVVAKIVAEGVVHKYDIGGVETHIEGVLDMEKAFVRLSDAVSKEKFKGVLVQEKIKSDVEAIIGVQYHPGFGHAIMFGLGGTLVEVMQDVVFAMAPLNRQRAQEMVASIKGAKLFYGFRGRPAVDTEALVDVLLAISDLVMEVPRIASLDINPLFISQQGVVIADARVLLREMKG